MVAPSCSLLHVPVDLDGETKLDAELKDWLAFAVQKLDEVAAWPVPRTASATAAISWTMPAPLGSRATSRAHP